METKYAHLIRLQEKHEVIQVAKKITIIKPNTLDWIEEHSELFSQTPIWFHKKYISCEVPN